MATSFNGSDNDSWGADCPISMPVPPPISLPILVDMGGFGITEMGLNYSFSTSDREEMRQPYQQPLNILMDNL